MSYCKQLGKDKIMFLEEKELSQESDIQLSPLDDDDAPGIVLSNGEINWNCPCLGGIASGPCGYQFREAFNCFYKSKAEYKGSDCYEKFSLMQECMSSYPNLYSKDNDTMDEINEELEKSTKVNENSTLQNIETLEK